MGRMRQSPRRCNTHATKARGAKDSGKKKIHKGELNQDKQQGI